MPTVYTEKLMESGQTFQDFAMQCARAFGACAVMRKHKPEAGGYYVVYVDGYKSFSPAKAFEDGYTILP